MPELVESRRKPVVTMPFAIKLWIVLAVLVVGKTLIAPTEHTLFPKFSAGAERWLTGEPLNIGYKGMGAFRYSPTFAVLMVPFSQMGLRLGGVMWSLFGLGVFLWGVRVVVRDVLPGEWPGRRTAILLLLVLGVAQPAIWNSQGHVLAGGLFMGGCWALVRGRHWLSAALLAGSILVKVSPLAPALLLVVLYPRALGLRLPIAVLAGLAVPFLTQWPATVIGQYRGWFGHMVSSSSERWPTCRDAWTIWELVAGQINLPAYRATQMVAALIVLVICLWYLRPNLSDRVRVTVAATLGMAYVMMFGPAVERPTLALFGVFSSWAVMESLDQPRARWLGIGGYVCSTVLSWGLCQRLTQNRWPVFMSALPVGAFLILVWTALYAARQRRAAMVSGHEKARGHGDEQTQC